MSDPRVEGIELLVPPGREKEEVGNEGSSAKADVETPGAVEQPRGQASESGGEPPAKSAAEEMRGKLQTPTGRELYRQRKAIVEAVFGQVEERRGLRGFSMRGLEKAAAEWQIICLTHNLLKLYKARTASAGGAEGEKSHCKSTGSAHLRRNRSLFAIACTLLSNVWRWCRSDAYAAAGNLSFIPTDS